MEIDRRAFIASLGGTAAVSLMDSEAKADALEHWMEEQLDEQVAAPGPSPRSSRPSPRSKRRSKRATIRRGAGSLFVSNRGNVKKLEPMPKNPTHPGFLPPPLRARQSRAAERDARAEDRHVRGNRPRLPAARLRAVLIKPDHGWWGAQLFEPYIPEKSTFAIRYHQTLRFYPDADAGYEYPDQYFRIFGEDYKPPAAHRGDLQDAQNHKWYMEPRLVTVNDLYAFDPNAKVSIDPFAGHHRPPLQVAERRPRQRQQPERAHVAHAGESRSAAVMSKRLSLRPEATKRTCRGYLFPLPCCDWRRGRRANPPTTKASKSRRSASSARRTSR